jgi:transitional endoplasmic reticulum ATPase
MARINFFDADQAADQVVDEHSHRSTQVTQVDAERAALLATLDKLGGLSTNTDDKLVYQGDRFVFPSRYKDNIPGIYNYLKEYERAQNAQTSFVRYFPARPNDGAAAMERAMRLLFGSTGAGVPTFTMFGANPPQRKDVKVSLTETISVPWGQISFEPLEAVFETHATNNEDGQYVFALSVTAPKRQEKRIRAFFDLIDREIALNSIYRGKAISVNGGGTSEPKFIDLSGVDPNRVIYAADVYRLLTAGLWAPIKYAEKLKAQGQSLSTTTLLEGPFGTGKSLAGYLTAQIAVAHGWTYIHVEPGEPIEKALELARQYGPAVVWIEDVDIVAGGNQDRKRVVKVLEALDGVTTKVDGGLIVGMTTNHVNSLDAAVLRPGRIDTIVHVAEPDRPAFEGIIKATLPGDQSAKLDFDELWESMGSTYVVEDGVSTVETSGMLPAFIVGAVKDSVRFALSRSGGEDPTVTTVDILDAARSLRRTFDLQQASLNAPKPVDPVGVALETAVERVMERAVPVDAVDGQLRYGSAFSFKAANNDHVIRKQKHAQQ